MAKDRPSRDAYFMNLAKAASEMATCTRRKVGAILVRDRRVISTGYNGAPAGMLHCLDDGCEMEHGHCVRCLHAELNAVIQSPLGGAGLVGATLYTTASPCRHCMMVLINVGVARVVYGEPYRDPSHHKDEGHWAIWAASVRYIEMCQWTEGQATVIVKPGPIITFEQL